MNILQWVNRLPDEFYSWGSVNAYPVVPKPYVDVLKTVQGMTTPSTMHLLNLAVQCLEPNECYLEVGTWRGATLIGALLGNDAFGVAIDDDSMNEHDGDERDSYDVWEENINTLSMTERTEYVSGSVPDVWSNLFMNPKYEPVGVYLFDGDKSTEDAAYEGLAGVIPFLADEALIVVDDANEITIRMAVHRFECAYPTQVFKILDIPTPGNCWPCFWNGVMALVYKR